MRVLLQVFKCMDLTLFELSVFFSQNSNNY